MNKLLATSALVAAGLVASAGVASAQAPSPIQVVVGGFMHQYFGSASNNDGVFYSPGNGRGSNGLASANPTSAVGQMNKTSQQSDAEIFVGGRSTLSNGIVIGFDVQLEGNSDTNINKNMDQVDESYIFIDGAFGRALIGSEDDASFLMHYGAPAPGATWGANEAYTVNWVHKPAQVRFIDTTASKTATDAQRLTYFTPRFSGLQFGVSYTPNALEDVNGMNDVRAARANGWSPAVNYVNTIGGVRVAASAGVSYFPELDGAAATTSNGNSIKDYSLGLQLGMGAFTVGGGYRVLDNNLGLDDGTAWSIGGAYQAGPIAVSASYLQSTANGTATVGDDVVKQMILSGAYTMGPGVDLIGSLFSVSYKDEGGAAINQNSGTGGVVGIRLMF
jgi:outer membrane protein OmpU